MYCISSYTYGIEKRNYKKIILWSVDIFFTFYYNSLHIVVSCAILYCTFDGFYSINLIRSTKGKASKMQPAELLSNVLQCSPVVVGNALNNGFLFDHVFGLPSAWQSQQCEWLGKRSHTGYSILWALFI